jgi:hypothetical protein
MLSLEKQKNQAKRGPTEQEQGSEVYLLTSNPNTDPQTNPTLNYFSLTF